MTFPEEYPKDQNYSFSQMTIFFIERFGQTKIQKYTERQNEVRRLPVRLESTILIVYENQNWESVWHMEFHPKKCPS